MDIIVKKIELWLKNIELENFKPRFGESLEFY